jgi:hypothetical protein
MAILSLLCMTYVMGLLVIAKSYTFEKKLLKMRVSRCRVKRHLTLVKFLTATRIHVHKIIKLNI